MNPESNDPKNSKNPLDNMPKGSIWTALIITLALVLLISWIYGSNIPFQNIFTDI